MTAWVYFIILSVFAWGSSFFFIKIALREILPFNIVAWRLTVGLVVILTILSFVKVEKPKSTKLILHFFVLGIINTAFPFTFITWSEQALPSSIAGIINGSTPLLTMLIASAVIASERLTAPKIIGCIMGFIGIALILTENNSVSSATNDESILISTIVLIGAAVSYAIGAIYSRMTMTGLHPLWVASASLISATIFMWIVVWISPEPLQIPASVPTLFSLFWMGAVGTALAYYLYFYLIQAWGPSKASMVAYVMPLSAVFMGIVFLSERLSLQLSIGAALIIGGVYVAIQIKSVGTLFTKGNTE